LDVQADQSHLRKTVDYLEGLVSRYMDANVNVTPNDEAPTRATDRRPQPPTFRDGTGGVERFSAGVLLENLRFMFISDAESKGLALRIIPSSLTLTADPLILMRILSNLIANAIKYTRHGRVLVGCQRSGRDVRIRVIDTGIGIAPEDLKRLLKPFERGHDTDVEGHGLGLAITRKLAEEHGLRMSVRSSVGKGTEVTILIPPAPDKPGSGPATSRYPV
jgi:signal transduction histidine kinase